MDIADKEREDDMKKIDITKEPCSECRGKLQRKIISQEFERNGMTVKLSGIVAYVCSNCDEKYFLPGGAEKVAEAANSLFALALLENQHKHKLTAQIC